MRGIGLFITVLVVLTTLPMQAQRQLEPLPVEVLTKAKELMARFPLDLSPDGRWVAYVAAERDRLNGLSLEGIYTHFTPTGVPMDHGATGYDVWITNTGSGESRSLTEGKGTNWGPVWSPDDQRLAFYSDRSGKAGLWVWEKATGKIRQVGDVVIRHRFMFQVVSWTRDSRRVLCKVLQEGMTLDEAARLTVEAKKEGPTRKENIATVTVLNSPAAAPTPGKSSQGLDEAKIEVPSWTNGDLADLALIDIDTGGLQRIVRGTKARWISFSPDESYVAFTDFKGVEANSQQPVYDIVLYSIADGRTRVLASNVRQTYGMSVSWSPNGQLLSYTTGGRRTSGDCFVLPLDGGQPRKLGETPHPSFEASYRPPIWDGQSKSLYLVGDGTLWRVDILSGRASELAKIPNRRIIELVTHAPGRPWSLDSGRSIVAITQNDETKQAGFYKIDLTTGAAAKLIEEGKRYGPVLSYSFDLSADGNRMVYRAQDARHPEELWVASADFQDTRQLTHLNPAIEKYEVGQSRLIEWRSVEGKKLRGALLLPADFKEGRRYPLIVWVYGGAFGSNQLNAFGLGFLSPAFNMQMLATRGYAVLYPDAPLRVGTPMKDLLHTVMPGVSKTIELGIADPERLGVMGQSYGGYSTLALIVQTTRFKAAVMTAGIGNLIGYYGQMDPDGSTKGIGFVEEGQGGMGGTLWQHRDRYIENSPIFFLDRVQTPLMIVHGTADTASPVSQANEVFVYLRRLGKEVEYLRYEGEGHAIQTEANVIDVWNRRIAWLDRWLKVPASTSKTSQ